MLDPIREKAADYLEGSLALMNDSGAHWIKGEYATSLAGGGTAYCMKGAINARKDKLSTQIFEKIKRRFGSDNWYTKEAIAAREKKEDELTKVADVAEVALAYASFKLMEADEQNFGIRHLRSHSDEQSYETETIAEPLITGFNDNEKTTWERVVEAHRMAVAGLRNGEFPTEWKDLYNPKFMPELKGEAETS